ncbi:pectinesterase family protein [Petroclostridium xylanilyticum]|uniref:pectinesterase family protein n=1 Tax=Petroclostridium xylanilyticum TaxID=1792311 RepID=UPI000B98C7DE|nr:pectinesterase family protein [Petroclostridium xylanilyticum]
MIVSQDGSGGFKTIQEAIDTVPENNSNRVTIHVKNGIYKEKLIINKPFITLIGEIAEKTIITFDDYANKLFPNGEKYGTFNSYTSLISADDFIAENITFENSAGDGRIVGQALAAYVDADRVIFRNCRFLGCQDTIFTAPLPPRPLIGNTFGGPGEGKEKRKLRQYFESCYIKGDVDFIFGSATAVFHKCEIFSNDRDDEVNGYITAASTPECEKYGYVFIDCKLISNAKPNTVYLGRPWRDFAKTVFINTWMGEHIKNEGWHNWNKENAEKNVFYAEYNSYGPGAQMDKRVKWAKILTKEEAKEYSIHNVLSGKDNWNPCLDI